MNRYSVLHVVEKMLNNKLQNYIVPGLSSSLVGGGEHGKVRMFHAEREQLEFITPHSHRFDFVCIVLEGAVRNAIFSKRTHGGDEWCMSTIDQVCGTDGIRSYVHTRDAEPVRMKMEVTEYKAGDSYRMTYDQIHSIKFSKDTKVLFFEGPQITSTSRMIEPWVDGKVVPTFKTEDWMFQKE